MSEFRRRLMMQSKADNPILKDYLTIVSLEDGLTAKLSTNACEYCVDGDGVWKTLPANTDTEPINAGQTLSFRGNLAPVSSSGIGTFTVSKYHNLKGNCMSMLFGDDAKNKFSLDGYNYAFQTLFTNNQKLIDASEFVLQANILSKGCYTHMFNCCTALTFPPKLPATTLAEACYNGMFMSCTSITNAPELSSTILFSECYSHMFYNCQKLRNAPKLLATTLASGCYRNMFYLCKSLTNATDLPATTLASRCYEGMFNGVSNLIIAPDLPATNLSLMCYYRMFKNCNKLTYIKMMATDIGAQNCLYDWVNGVATEGTFVKNKDATWDVVGVNGVPDGWTVITE